MSQKTQQLCPVRGQQFSSLRAIHCLCLFSGWWCSVQECLCSLRDQLHLYFMIPYSYTRFLYQI